MHKLNCIIECESLISTGILKTNNLIVENLLIYCNEHSEMFRKTSLKNYKLLFKKLFFLHFENILHFELLKAT